MFSGILSAIGNTPLIKLERVLGDLPFDLYGKLEAFNPGGSMKDRAALNIISRAMAEGRIDKNTVIIESSSGNMGIGLAQVCAYFGLQFICVVDPKTTSQNIHILRAYGTEVDVVREPDPVTKEYLHARIERVKELTRQLPNSYWPNQYSNVFNAGAHERTMSEIVSELGGSVDYLFCATSTCGTLRGCAEYIRAHGLPTKLIGVDAVGSIIFGGPPFKRLIPGHGAARLPELYRPDLASRSIHVTDLDCVVGCRLLLRKEAIMAGGSSGAVLMALALTKDDIPPGSTVAMILPDRGERYLDTLYSDEWVAEHFGDVAHMWEEFDTSFPEIIFAEQPAELSAVR
ncbi:MAG TPA: 2,3-diaminopropionate biosynthesis protein SbnA [Pyrinomonadaceae bacterium]|jgi:cysteine synthase A|nr:2,3-diaminopropionate biosynthesis protein SbnA [Pyrinomonadaceae bacterium]